MKPWQQAALREIPPVNAILESPTGQRLLAERARPLVVAAVGEALDALRRQIAAAQDEEELAAADRSPEGLAALAAEMLRRRLRPRLRRVVNATGVVIHTNMGRAPLAEEAVEAIAATAGRYNNLELDLSTGERGSRYAHVEGLLAELTGAEAAMVVNNNAAAVLLMLSALAAGREVVVSRGELVEIGGSFRVPEVITQGGARLVEVGTTNKTHPRDYEAAIGPETGALLKVHRSNFRLVGFTAEVPVAELAEIAHRHGLPCLVDWGSGVMLDLTRFGLPHEATMPELIADGADLVTFSGDKLLGAPQGGFIVGRRELVERCRRHPLTRALRVDKLTLAGIEATLKLYLEPERAVERVPAVRMLTAPREQIAPRADALARKLEAAGIACEVIDGVSRAGGGALPAVDLPTRLVAVPHPAPQEVEARLRAGDPPVMVRIQAGALLLDPRTLWDDEVDLVVSALRSAIV
ncbi:L-seryl-tRNA(Ser) seleniumtransferase [Symbiobacterium terraclitae]|uniref:L-seryl-tRNA(Sec) selenium transferase n=1 Tax=Symbiobacterium terraclitae TaxID=557451 RepID=A0ABS4JUY7_9FIRM|nr:L-seryl-tRNA(Sec) selenium transferase [Symbiobacterium terraclitae]MBP2019323.1 L-seryl-tRNA(Ser) seleniumtransferase [Symbiobacterium terraclitae]